MKDVADTDKENYQCRLSGHRTLNALGEKSKSHFSRDYLGYRLGKFGLVPFVLINLDLCDEITLFVRMRVCRLPHVSVYILHCDRRN